MPLLETSTEARFVARLGSRLKQGESMVLVAPQVARVAERLDHWIRDPLWNGYLTKNLTFQAEVPVGQPPPLFLQNLLSQPEPVETTANLREGLRDQPLTLLLYTTPGSIPPAGVFGYLEQWLQHAARFQGSGSGNRQSLLRLLILVTDPATVAELRASGWDVETWPAVPVDELMGVARLQIGGALPWSRLDRPNREFLLRQVVDLAGESRWGVEDVLDVLEPVVANNSWRTGIPWPHTGAVDLATEAWAPVLEPAHAETLTYLVSAGGRLFLKGSDPHWLHWAIWYLWGAGLFVWSSSNPEEGWLTPLAIKSLKGCWRPGGARERVRLDHMAPPMGHVTASLVERCLWMERLLKRELQEFVELKKSEQAVLNFVIEQGLTDWIQRAGSDPLAWREVVEALMLGDFFQLRLQVMGSYPSALKSLRTVRNLVMHGVPGDYGMEEQIRVVEAWIAERVR